MEDIRRTCGSLQHHTSSTARVGYKDEDGDFANLNVDDTDDFQEMFVRASSVDEGLDRKNTLRPCLYGLRYPRQPSPRVTLGEIFFLSFV